MLRKLASFFFQEEEIVLEEDLKEESEENYKIPEIKPMKARRAPEKPVEQESKVSLEEKNVSLEDTNKNQNVVEESETKEKSEKTNKSKKITADSVQDQSRSKSKKSASVQVKQEEYQPQEIISPIFGGSQKPTPKVERVDETVEKPKVNKTKTTVISPMYGMMEEEVNEIFDEELLNFDLKDMLSASEDADEVQVTLYDFLEESEDDK